MKLDQDMVDEFKEQQEEWGTEVALFNLLWNKAYEDLKSIGIHGIKTRNDGDHFEGEITERLEFSESELEQRRQVTTERIMDGKIMEQTDLPHPALGPLSGLKENKCQGMYVEPPNDNFNKEEDKETRKSRLELLGVDPALPEEDVVVHGPYEAQTKEAIVDLRARLGHFIRTMIKVGPLTKEASKVVDYLTNAKMWLGLCLGRLDKDSDLNKKRDAKDHVHCEVWDFKQ